MIDYPILLETHLKMPPLTYKKTKKRFVRKVIYISLAAGIIAAVMIHPLLHLIGKYNLYNPYMPAYYTLIIANILYNLSLIPHYLLYVLKKDYQIMITTVAGTIISLLLNYILIYWYDAEGAAYAMLSSFMIIMKLE